MSDLEDLYREIILDHYRNPRNKGALPVPPAHKRQGMNPLCGDEIDVYLELDATGPEPTIAAVTFAGQGCSISQSSASMMSAALKGKTVSEAQRLVRAFKAMMSIHGTELSADDVIDGTEVDAEPEDFSDVRLGDLGALRGVVKFPVRIKCATLAWNTFSQALDELTAR